MKPSPIIILGLSDIGRAAATRRSTFSKGICPNFNHSHSRNARVHARVRRFSCFCLHLFTFRLYLAENKRLVGEGFIIWKNELYSYCSMTYG